jgi:hypothetical protein
MIHARPPLDGGARAGYGAARERLAKGEPGPVDEQPRGKVDLTSILYIVGGIPALVGFLVVIFAFARSCNLPA